MNAAFAFAGDICTRSHFDPWENVRDRPSSEIVADLKRCREDFLIRLKSSKDTSERFFGPESVASFVVDERTGRLGVRFSKLFEVGDVQFRSDEPEPLDLLGSSCGTPIFCKG